MPDTTQNTSTAMPGGESHLPLYEFFVVLQQNGFSVTPEQMVQATQLVYHFAPKVAFEPELCNYLSPLIARSEEEQLQFAAIFEAHFGKTPAKETTQENWQQEVKNHFRRYKWWYTAGLILVIAGIFLLYSPSNPKPAITHFNLQLEDLSRYEKEQEGRQAFQVRINEKLSVAAGLANPDMDTSHFIKLKTRYNWGDGSATDTVPSHIYTAAGIYNLQANTSVLYKDTLKYIDTLTEKVKVCQAVDKLLILNASNRDSFTIGEKIQLRANLTGSVPDRFIWVNDPDTLGYGPQLDTAFQQKGNYSIYCAAIYDSLNSPCTVVNHTNFTVYDSNAPKYHATISPSTDALPLSLPYRVKRIWLWLTGGIALTSFLTMLIIAMRSNNRKQQEQASVEKTANDYKNLLQSFAGKKQPAELPFLNKNYLPVPEEEITEVAIRMRRRVEGAGFYLNIPQTISRAIQRAGFFEPVYVPRLHQNEYLVLIDASNSQMAHLFDFLLDLLKKQNVFIEKYYYRNEPNLCYNATSPNGATLETLAEKYSHHTLLIFGKAYELLYAAYPIFNETYQQLLSRWERKAILTPVPLPDWADKEIKVLLPNLPVLPVDVPGLLELMPVLFNQNADVFAYLQQYRKEVYSITAIDFENVAALENYCAAWPLSKNSTASENVMLQWIAALAVYPRLRWEITLAIGKTLLDKYGLSEELNFTTLLRIARISWMGEGRFPDETRLELLKILTTEYEVLARQTILALLNEIPETELNEKHFAWQEKEIQRITNEFILYAYDPQTYTTYKSSEELYRQLLADKKIKDVISRLYLKNGKTENWTTPLRRFNGTEQMDGMPLEEYFITKGQTSTPSITSTERWLIRLGIFGSFVCGLGLLFLPTIDLLHTNRFPLFMWRPPVEKEVRFKIQADTAIRSGLAELNVNGSYYTIALDSSITGNVLMNGSLKKIDVTFDGQNVLDTNLNLISDSYSINLRRTSQQPASKITATIFLDKCITDSALYSQVIHQVDNTITVRTSLDMVNRIVNSTCNYTISYTQAVSEKKIDSLIAAFRQRGIPLQKGLQWVPGAIPEQIRIYATPPTNKPAAAKPVIYIQYNKESSEATASRNQLTQCLSNDFTFLNAQYKPNLLGFYRNVIRYYNRSFLDSIKPLLACLRRIYPDREFAVTQISGGQSAMDASAKIWIYDEADRTKVSIAYGDQVSMTSTGYVNVGPFVKNSKGELFFICVGSNLPALNTSVTRPSRVPNLPPIGVLYAKSNTHTRIGLIKLNESNVNVDYGHGTIRSSKVAAVGDNVMLYDPLTGTNISGAGSTGEVVATNVSTTLIAGKQPIKISGAFTTTMLSSSASDGNLLVDENNFALGILIGSDDKSIVFVPIDKILKEFGVTLVTNNQSPAQAN